VTGLPDFTLGELGAQDPGTYHETFHFALNNHVAKDKRIPPYGMSYDKAARRNSLPVPANQYGNPGSSGLYAYWDDVTLNPPNGAIYAEINLLYQPTSWEYVQFLWKANKGQNAFLANEGVNLLDAWLKTDMAAPHVMASTMWRAPDPDACEGDFDGDRDVDGSDLAVFAADFGRTDCSDDCEGDFDHDGDVDGSDLAVFAADFGRTDCP